MHQYNQTFGAAAILDQRLILAILAEWRQIFMVNVFVANTENAWFDFLSSEPDLTEVNFWSPGEMSFRALKEGELSSLPTKKSAKQDRRLRRF